MNRHMNRLINKHMNIITKISLLTIMTLGILLTGCSKEEAQDPELTKKQEYEYTHINTMLSHICDEGTPIGDWSYGVGNENASGTRFNKDCPIFTIFVNPFATDEVIELYVEDLLVMDRHMAANKPYMKYIRKEAPYTVSFDCRGEEFFRVNIDGTVEHDEIFDKLKECIKEPRKKADSEIAEFNNFMASNDDIQRGPEGDFYFLLDSKNLSDSLDQVLPMIDKIISAYPFTSDEVTGWYGSFEYLDVPGESYQIYFDEYGNDPLFGFDSFNFSLSSDIVLNSAYCHFVPTGTFKEDIADTYYYFSIYNGETRSFGGFDRINSEDGTITEEEICDILYQIYDTVITAHEEHGIRPLQNMSLSGSGYLNELDEFGDKYIIETNVEVPMEERISREEFNDLVMAGTERVHLRDRQLGDCE